MTVCEVTHALLVACLRDAARIVRERGLNPGAGIGADGSVSLRRALLLAASGERDIDVNPSDLTAVEHRLMDAAAWIADETHDGTHVADTDDAAQFFTRAAAHLLAVAQLTGGSGA